MLHPIGKQAYKLKAQKRWKIPDVFHVSWLDLNNIRKARVEKKVTELEFEAGNSKEYKVEAIWDGAIYANEGKS